MTSLAELADPLDHAHRHVESLSATGHPYRIGERFARLDAVTPASLRAFARKYLDPEKRLAAWHRWPSDGEKVSADGVVSYDDGR